MNILVIRRDNIGDLLCTTPMLHSLRQQQPDAWIGVLANSYNGPILEGNPDVDQVFIYRKGKHREPGETLLSVWWATLKQLWALRRRRLDLIIVASPGGGKFARWIGARQIVEHGQERGRGHEVEITQRLLSNVGMTAVPGPMHLAPDPQVQSRLLCQIPALNDCRYRIAVHLSARKIRQRWPEENFIALIQELLHQGAAEQVLVFWAPGAESDPMHPGDDAKAERVLAALAGEPVYPIVTHSLAELVAGLATADMVICADGGAMHIAAALGKPVLAMFGNSSVEQWRPWAVPHEVLQPVSQDVRDLSVDLVVAAVNRLRQSATA